MIKLGYTSQILIMGIETMVVVSQFVIYRRAVPLSVYYYLDAFVNWPLQLL